MYGKSNIAVIKGCLKFRSAFLTWKCSGKLALPYSLTESHLLLRILPVSNLECSINESMKENPNFNPLHLPQHVSYQNILKEFFPLPRFLLPPSSKLGMSYTNCFGALQLKTSQRTDKKPSNPTH